jgi:hypothetical protein
MACILGWIGKAYTEEQYAKYKSTAGTAPDNKRRQVDCEICGASLVAGSHHGHLESQHDVFCSMVLQHEIVVDRPPVIYRAIKSIAADTYICPLPHYVGKASTKWNSRRHFLDRNPQDLVVIPSERSVSLPQCKRCECRRMLVPSTDGTSVPNSAMRSGNGRFNMRPLRPLGSPSHSRLQCTGTSLRGWKCSNIWEGCWHTTTRIPMLCKQT